MKLNTLTNTARNATSSLCKLPLLALVAASINSFVAVSHAEPPANSAGRSALKKGDILYVDSGNAVEGGGLFKLDPQTGERTVVSMGGLLQMPFSVSVDAKSGLAVVSDSGRLIAVDPSSGSQAVIADNRNRNLGMPLGMDFDARGDLVVANAQNIIRLEARAEEPQVLSSGGSMRCPLGVAAGRNGDLFVVNMGFPAEILRVNPRTGSQTVVTRGGMLNSPQAIAVSGENLYVTDVATAGGNFGIGRVLRIDATTGKQSVVSEGGLLVGPVGIAIGADGKLIVADPYTINPASPDLYDGALVAIDPSNGDQTLLARGAEGFVNPRGVAIVPPLGVAN